jgi:hypothetical protein
MHDSLGLKKRFTVEENVVMEKRQIIPLAGLIATIAMAMYMVAQLNGQAAMPAGDFRNAAIAEVHDGQGQVLLRGEFAVTSEEDDEVERKARLEPTGVDPDAAGEAEVEFSKNAPAQQEIEFSIRNLQPGSALTFLIDGQSVGQATVDRRGRAEMEVDIAG